MNNLRKLDNQIDFIEHVHNKRCTLIVMHPTIHDKICEEINDIHHSINHLFYRDANIFRSTDVRNENDIIVRP